MELTMKNEDPRAELIKLLRSAHAYRRSSGDADAAGKRVDLHRSFGERTISNLADVIASATEPTVEK